jgi:hypothetical protein
MNLHISSRVDAPWQKARIMVDFASRSICRLLGVEAVTYGLRIMKLLYFTKRSNRKLPTRERETHRFWEAAKVSVKHPSLITKYHEFAGLIRRNQNAGIEMREDLRQG